MADYTRFQDFDDKDHYTRAITKARSHTTRNLVVDFSSESASYAFDLDCSDFENLIKVRSSDSSSRQRQPTRWIHLWRPEDQKDTIHAIAEHYGFSPRLALSMQSDPMKPQPVTNLPPRQTRLLEKLHNRSKKSLTKFTSTEKVISIDVESAERHDNVDAASNLDLNHYRIVNELWHFMSVDWGHKYTSIGYNALYNTKAKVQNDEISSSHSRPEGTRVWWWIVLCDDGTVFSIQENPFPGVDSLNSHQQQQLESIRYNCINVFKQLSIITLDEKHQNPIMTVAVRAGRLTNHAETHIAEEDSASLLLYYLFDDWYSIYSLVAKSEHQYRVQLDNIRQQMFQSARLEHVHKLHSLGRQLSILKRMYEGYDLIIERVINGPQQRLKSHALTHTTTDLSQASSKSADELRQALQAYGVPISPAAALRFERLADRIKLYALSEIQSCLEEKDSLMTMNFNLIAIKEESYVERLTRVTILLAKVTIMFIPVSLMATYFTIQFPDIQYTPTQFWAAFGVIMFISILGLVLFGALSGTQEAGPIYKSLTRSGIDAWRAIQGRPVKNKTV